MEFGMFHEFDARPGQNAAAAFDDAFELVDAAESWGLDAMWLAEIHGSPERSVLSAPLTVASAIAARTRRIKIGTAVQVLPLGHPLRLAEEAATVDQISRGRLIFGVGRSGFARTYAAYGVPYAESRQRFAETLEVVTTAWTHDTFSYDGHYFHFEKVCVVPKPFQRPHPPIRVAATSPDTFPALGAQGYPIFAAVRFGTFSELGPNITSYRAAYARAGHTGRGEVFLRVPVYLAPSGADARAEPEASIMAFYRGFAEQLLASAAEAGARDVEQRAERALRLQQLTYDDVLREKVVVGTPEQVADRLHVLSDELGLDGVLAELNCGTAIPRDLVTRSLRLLCERVMPEF
jgi:alkanesulfonate monooxygenase SsuD/methylene tetrahydromethanopterin reductase-like flavin-dependent oxidoreductase (luciferase family)